MLSDASLGRMVFIRGGLLFFVAGINSRFAKYIISTSTHRQCKGKIFSICFTLYPLLMYSTFVFYNVQSVIFTGWRKRDKWSNEFSFEGGRKHRLAGPRIYAQGEVLFPLTLSFDRRKQRERKGREMEGLHIPHLDTNRGREGHAGKGIGRTNTFKILIK